MINLRALRERLRGDDAEVLPITRRALRQIVKELEQGRAAQQVCTGADLPPIDIGEGA